MPITLRLCLYEKGTSDPQFREAFEGLDDVTVLGHSTAWNEFQDHLRFGNVDAVAVNLDCEEAKARLISVQRIAEVAPDCAIIGISSSTNPDDIIGAMRAGCTQFVRAPIDVADLRTALERIRKRHLPVAEGCQQIAMIGSSGGAGTTTVACNLSLELAHLTGRRIGLVDMDLQFGDIACMFDRAPKFSVADLCRSGMEIDRTLLGTALDELPCNVSILARPEKFEDSEEVCPDAVEQLFRNLGAIFPFVVVDLPRYLTQQSMRALQTSERVFIVSQLAVPFLRNATRIYKCLLQAGIDEARIELILNRCNADHERIKPAEVEKHFGRPVYAIVPNDYKHVTASRDLGHPILAAAPNSPARVAIQKLARQLATAHLGEETLEKDKGGLFGGRCKKTGAGAAAG